MLQSGLMSRQRFHGKVAEHLWCSCCARTFPIGTYREVGNVRRCPYAGCGGHSIVDAVDWATVRDTNTEFPYTPQLGTKYAFVLAQKPRGELSLSASCPTSLPRYAPPTG